MTRPNHSRNRRCGLCGKTFSPRQVMTVGAVRPAIAEELDKRHPDWRKSGYVCIDDLQAVRRELLEARIRKERGELTALDKSVLASLERDQTLTADVEQSYSETMRLGDWLADRMAGFAGSWVFIMLFGLVLFVWMAVNSIPQDLRPFDPFPYILLNLILSCIAAIQAPLIMMSQRRLEEKDRLRSKNDYQVNLKAELEIRHLHEKIDHYLIMQLERMADIQEMQLQIMDELAKDRPRPER